ncbi:MAG: hypothetical protein JNM99_11360 [Verrucomicrobiaceae bacterium]|nr:hypothetical protein [Verrucomicrobiaceae bacterium]
MPLLHLILLFAVVLVSVALTIAAHRFAKRQALKAVDIPDDQKIKVSYDSAKDALESLRNWALWLVTVETSAMAAIGLLTKSDLDASWAFGQRLLGASAVWFFGVSVFYFGWLLGGVPSIRQRLERNDGEHGEHVRLIENDIYTRPLFAGLAPFRTLEYFASLCHYLGILGLILFAFFFITGLLAPKAQASNEIAVAIKRLEKKVETSGPRVESLSQAIEKLAASIAEAARKDQKASAPPEPTK